VDWDRLAVRPAPGSAERRIADGCTLMAEG
jgi:hypothetical protein